MNVVKITMLRDWVRRILTIGLVFGIVLVGIEVSREVGRLMRQEPQQQSAPSYVAGKLPGLPAYLEKELEEARREGAAGLRRFLSRYYAQIQDPRLAEIELDYVVLVGVSDPEEAKRILKRLEGRIKPNSPLYERYRALCRSYLGSE